MPADDCVGGAKQEMLIFEYDCRHYIWSSVLEKKDVKLNS